MSQPYPACHGGQGRPRDSGREGKHILEQHRRAFSTPTARLSTESPGSGLQAGRLAEPHIGERQVGSYGLPERATVANSTAVWRRRGALVFLVKSRAVGSSPAAGAPHPPSPEASPPAKAARNRDRCCCCKRQSIFLHQMNNLLVRDIQNSPGQVKLSVVYLFLFRDYGMMSF